MNDLVFGMPPMGPGGSRPPRHRARRIRARVVRSSQALPLSNLRAPENAGEIVHAGWEEMPNFQDQHSLRDWWLRQQKRRQTDAEQRAPGMDYYEPPFPLDVLTTLGVENGDFYAVVDQLATDTAGLGWHIKPKKGTAAGDDPLADEQAAAAEAQAKQIEAFLRAACLDYFDNHISLTTLFKSSDVDYDSTGCGYIEVASSWKVMETADPVTGEMRPVFADVMPQFLYHVPSRLVRRLKGGRGWKEIDEYGRDVAVFRNWGSDPNDPDSVVSPEEARRYKNVEAGQLKNELKEWMHYHPATAYYGIPPIIAALRSVLGNIHAENRNLRFFINRGFPDWIVQLKADALEMESDTELRSWLDDAAADLEEQIKYLLEGEDHRAMILEIPRDKVEMSWEQVGAPVKDQDFPSYRVDNRDAIVRVYRVPPARLGIIETANLGSGSGQNQSETYKSSQVDPRQNERKEFLDEIIQRRLGANVEPLVEFRWVEMDVTDELREAQIIQVLAATKLFSGNELRIYASLRIPDLEVGPYKLDDRADQPMFIVEADSGAAGGGFGLPFGASLQSPPALQALPPGTLQRMLRADLSYHGIHRAIADGMREARAGARGRMDAARIDDRG